jgi:hypothetical protein
MPQASMLLDVKECKQKTMRALWHWVKQHLAIQQTPASILRNSTNQSSKGKRMLKLRSR